MRFLSIMGNSFGCSASGERLVSAARDGDLQEAKALLEYNPRLGRYSTFGLRNSPLHYSAAQGHHEIVSLLLESGVEINLRNYRGQTALMQACQYGHWEVVQILMLFRANIRKADYINGGTALHFAASNGHSRCIRLLLANYVPSIPDFWNIIRKRTSQGSSTEVDEGALSRILNKTADGGITALHMASLNGHHESVHLLIDLGASVSEVTVEDGTTIDLIEFPVSGATTNVEFVELQQMQCDTCLNWQAFSLPVEPWSSPTLGRCLTTASTVSGCSHLTGAGSTPLHYAACGGNAKCCQVLIARGASLTAENANGWTPLMVARSWHRHWLEGILSRQSEGRLHILPSPYLSLPLMSMVKIARECGWRNPDPLSTCPDPCAVCLESKCTVAAEGCGHEFCTNCALYLCSTNSTSTAKPGPPGSIACPLCRHGIVSFIKLPGTNPIKETVRPSLSLSLCTACSSEGSDTTSISTPFCKPDFHCTRISPLASYSFRSLSCQRFPSMKINTSFCMGAPDTSPSLVPCTDSRRAHNQIGRCLRSGLRRSASQNDGRRSWFSLNQSVATGSG